MSVAGVADQGRAADLFGDAVGKRVVQVGGEERPGAVDTHDVLAVGGSPADVGVGRNELVDHGVEVGRRVGAQSGFGVGAVPWHVSGDGDAQVVDAVHRHAGSQAVLEGGGSRRQQPAHRQTEKPDPGWVDAGPGQHPVQDRGDDMFPVGTKYQALEAAGGGLAGPVEGQHVIAAFLPGGRAEPVQFFAGAVESAVHDHGRPTAGSMRVPTRDRSSHAKRCPHKGFQPARSAGRTAPLPVRKHSRARV